MKKCLIYNISLNIDRIDDLVRYVSQLGNIKFFLKDIFKSYKGCCQVYADIGYYTFEEPDYLVKIIKPYLHIIVFGTKISCIEKKIDKFLNKDFHPNIYTKHRSNDDPFESGNEELLYNISYKSNRFVVNQGKTLQVA